MFFGTIDRGVFFELPAGSIENLTANSAQTNRNIRHRRAMVIQRIFLLLITFSTLTPISPVVNHKTPSVYNHLHANLPIIIWGGYRDK